MTSLFAKEVIEGLQSEPKTIPSKYFYDKRGDELFQQIMSLDEYYLTRCELQIFQEHWQKLIKFFGTDNKPFELIELGAGDGMKTKVLLKNFSEAGANFTYAPIDISEHAVNKLAHEVKQELPFVRINPICNDYFLGINELQKKSKARKIVLFLGSSIGNIPDADAQQFLSKIGSQLSKGDILLTGFDLKKDPARILAAYNDNEGVTSEFNLNLLKRIKTELNAILDSGYFKHYALYDPIAGEARSYLVSTKDQEIVFPEQDTTITLKAWEVIHTEISRKYTLPDIERFAINAGFTVLEDLQDNECLFVDSVWVKN